MNDRNTQVLEDDLLAIGEAARLLGVSTDTLRVWASAGKIPSVRTLGGHRRFRRDEIEKALTGAG